jgi:hypothetical protein
MHRFRPIRSIVPLGCLVLASLFPAEAQIIPIPAQPVTDLVKPTKKNPKADSSPFNLIQIEEKLFFFAETRNGFGLYAHDVLNTLDPETNQPAIDLTGKKVAPKMIKPFKKAQEFDNQLAASWSPSLGSTKPKTIGAVYFHQPGVGVLISQGTRGSTKVIAKSGKKLDPETWPSDMLLFNRAGNTPHKLFFTAMNKKAGRTVHSAQAESDTSRVFTKKRTGVFPGIASSQLSDPFGYVQSQANVFFAAVSQVNGLHAIFHSDGINPPTRLDLNLDRPRGLVSDRSVGVLFNAPHSIGQVTRELYHASSTTVQRLTQTHVDPSEITVFTGSTALFAGNANAVNLGREVFKVTVGFSSITLELAHDIATGSASSNPSGFLGADGRAFFTADDGSGEGRRLYRSTGSGAPVIVTANDSARINVGESDEKTVLNNILFFTGTKAGEPAPTLWKIDVSAVNANATRVLTPGGQAVRNARNLYAFSLGLVHRLYFSCDGEGTEFANPDAAEARFRPRGRELWVTSD